MLKLVERMPLFSAGVPNLSDHMHPFRISTDEHVHLKFLVTILYLMTNHRFNSKPIMIFENDVHTNICVNMWNI